MPDPDADRSSALRSMVTRVLHLPVSRLAVGAGAIALAVSGLFGGLAQVDEPGPPRVAVNAVDKGVPWNVTVTGVRVVDKLDPLKLKKPGDRWVAVLAKVEVTADESRQDMTDVLRIPGVAGLLAADNDLDKGKPDYIYLLRDDVSLPSLNPGLPEQLAFIWEQRSSAAVPTRATVEIWGKTRRADSLTGHQEWLDPQVRAVVPDVPVQDRRNAT